MVLPNFAVELLKARLSPRHLTNSAINGHLYDPEGALAAGFLDQVVEAGQVIETATARATELGALAGPAFAANKKLIREHTLRIVEPTVSD